MYLVVGLGNPGVKYLKNMHNMGFMAIDILADNLGLEFNKKGFKGVYSLCDINGEKVMLLKPHTYMNLSGDSVVEAVNFYKISTEKVIVIYDDLDIDIGSLRIREKGSSGTHNGMRDIVKKLSSDKFPRIRVGTKPNNDSREIIDYVLSDIKKQDENVFKEVLKAAADSAEMFIKGKSLEEIMRKYNGKIC
ncbi:MAG: aminoacyl-tRNA hydrolase [Clostridia bacterium]|nr:aminoacyl-tRNA hydrolase [Clostridia bacterium]